MLDFLENAIYLFDTLLYIGISYGITKYFHLHWLIGVAIFVVTCTLSAAIKMIPILNVLYCLGFSYLAANFALLLFGNDVARLITKDPQYVLTQHPIPDIIAKIVVTGVIYLIYSHAEGIKGLGFDDSL